MNITLKELITSFTKSIDLYNYLLKNHHRRTAIAAYHMGVQKNPRLFYLFDSWSHFRIRRNS